MIFSCADFFFVLRFLKATCVREYELPAGYVDITANLDAVSSKPAMLIP